MNRISLTLVFLFAMQVLGQQNSSPSSVAPPTAPPGAPRSVSASDAASHVISRLRCSYPSAAKDAGITGTVKLKVRINEQGRVTAAKALSGDASLKTAGIGCAELTQYSPFLFEGRPEPVLAEVEITFPQDGSTQVQRDAYARNRTSAGQLVSSGNFSAAAALYRENLAVAEKENPVNQPEVAESASDLGHVYLKMSQMPEAEEALKKAMAAFQAEGVSDGAHIARTEEELAGIYLEQKDFHGAQAWFGRALPVLLRAKVSAGSPEIERTISTGIARALFGMASANFQSGDMEKANLYCTRTIAEAKTADLSNSDLKKVFVSCAGVSKALGKTAEADERQKRADQINLALVGTDPAPSKGKQ